MYAGCVEFEPIVHYIDSFMLNNLMTDRLDAVEIAFREKFHEWVRIRLENKCNVKMEKYHNYLFYIKQISQSSEEQLNLFFELCEEFFGEVHEQIKLV